MSVSFSVVFLRDLRGSCGSPDTSSQRLVVFIDERRDTVLGPWGHLAIVTAVQGPRGAFMNFLTPGKLESHALKPSRREKGPERLSPTPIQQGQARPFSVPSQSFARVPTYLFFFFLQRIPAVLKGTLLFNYESFSPEYSLNQGERTGRSATSNICPITGRDCCPSGTLSSLNTQPCHSGIP